MQTDKLYKLYQHKANNKWLVLGVLLAVFFGWLIAVNGISIATFFVLLPFIICYLILVIIKPRIGLISFIIYCFLMPTLGKHISGIQFGLGQDALLILTWLGVIFYRSDRYRLRHLNNDLVWLAVVWFVITLLQLANTNMPSIEGWLYEMRSATLYWILTVPLAIMLFNKKKDIDLFFFIIITFSFIGSLYGIKQLILGVDKGEMQWLLDGAIKTHMLFGKLRVFSYYSDAAQFGASQAHIAIVCFILAFGPYSIQKKMLFVFVGMVIFYGMIISGTRGALFGLVIGGIVFLILSKKLKILLIGSILGIGILGILKFTSIGNSNAKLARFRTSLDFRDPSLQVRFINQRVLRDYLSDKPFGTGVGTIGMWGVKYNPDKFISKIPPDSLFVKIWAMYGIVGFIIWFGMMVYIVGKSSGIIWKTRDPLLKNKLLALCSGATGMLMCSFGNEVLNTMPSACIVYISWAFVWLSPRWDTPIVKSIQS